MPPGTLLTRTTELLKRHKIRSSKQLGQHFLVDEEVLHRTIDYANLAVTDQILEIGTGTGVLTKALVEQVGLVYTIEKDARLFQMLSEELAQDSRIRLIHGDATKIDWPPCDQLVANLPYTISSPVLFKLFQSAIPKAVVMVQKEFGERLTAQPGTKQYGRLTVMAAYHAQVELLEIIAPEAFYPSPKVSSALVRIIREAQPPFDLKDVELFGKVVSALFNQRRKKIRTPLRDFLGKTEYLHIQENIPWLEHRVEELTPKQIAEISNIIFEEQHR